MKTTPRLAGDDEDVHARFLEGVVTLKQGVLRVACLYLPNGNPPETEKYPYKLKWMSRLLEYSKQRLKTEEPLVLAGDFNVIPAAQDVHNPAAWVNDALFRTTTRESFQSLLGLGSRMRCVPSPTPPASTHSGIIRRAPGRKTRDCASIISCCRRRPATG